VASGLLSSGFPSVGIASLALRARYPIVPALLCLSLRPGAIPPRWPQVRRIPGNYLAKAGGFTRSLRTCVPPPHLRIAANARFSLPVFPGLLCANARPETGQGLLLMARGRTVSVKLFASRSTISCNGPSGPQRHGSFRPRSSSARDLFHICAQPGRGRCDGEELRVAG